MTNNHTPEKEKGIIQKLFNIHWNNTEKEILVFTSCSELNDTSWGAWFGEIQDILRHGCYEEHFFNKCHIDLSHCTWGDPLPLLSLALTLNEYEESGGNISITFPSIPDISQIKIANTYVRDLKSRKTNTDVELIELCEDLLDIKRFDSYKNLYLIGFTKYDIDTLTKELKTKSILIIDQARFLKYLCREGFLDVFFTGTTVNFSSEDFNSRPRIIQMGNSTQLSVPTLLNELPVSLAFERSTCLVATIIKLDIKNIKETFDKIDKWVEQELHQSISQVVFEEVPSWAQGDLQYRLIILLRETLHNVVEHAYKNMDFGFAAVYIRYREGALGEDSTTWRQLKQFSKREENPKKTPLLQTRKLDSFSNTRTGFFEVFILDSGQGLFNSLNKSSTEDDLNNLHQSMLDVFLRNNTSKGKNRPTEHGGLYLLRTLLSPHQDYFRVRDEDAWWGTQVHLFNEKTITNRITQHAHGEKFGKKKITGLAWTVRLSWLEAQDYSGYKQLWRGVGNKDEQAPIRKMFKNNNEKSLFSNRVVIQDSRFPPFQPYLYSNGEYDKNVSEFLFLPRPLLMKNVIQDEIGQFLDRYNNFEISNLIIGDVPSEEAITYLAAIVHANKFQESPFVQIKKIIIVTRELRVCVLTRGGEYNSFNPNNSETKSIFLANTSNLAIYDNVTNYLRVLRRHDSHRIKEIISKNKKNSDFIKEEILWSNNIKLEGYLDFPQSLTHPLCREIYSLSLKRLTGLSVNACRLESLDSLVDSLITRFNAQIHPRLSKIRAETVIKIGSIKVTGYTEESEKQTDDQVFHFFRHASGKTNGSFLLPWIGTSDDIVKIEAINHPYKRVGKTPVIARGGWKSYEIPRFDQNSNCIYERNPIDSYRAWQEPSRSPMKLGHWVYGGHHEIFTINLLLAFNSELDHIGSGNSLAKFTFANFFSVFDIKEEDLNERNKNLISSIKEVKFNHLLPESLAEKKPLLVYPSHPVTDYIINEFLCLLEEDTLSKIRDNLIAILPVRRHRSGSGLQVSGITLERLKIAINTEGNRPVVYFDDGVISGRTYIEIKRLLQGMGYGDIYSIILLDRQRLPSVHHLKNDKHVNYWRLDAPSMGGKAHCPLCFAIDKINAIEDSIVSEVHQLRMKEWCDTWKELDPSTQWGNEGLRPIPINLKNPNPRFCLKYNPMTKKYEGIGKKDEQGIVLTNSAGLIAWVTELHTVTSRDDVSLLLIKKESENLSEEVRIQLLCSQLLLFSAEFDTKQAKNLAFALIKELWNLPRHDRHSALASLVLLSCVKEPFTLINEFLSLDDRWSELKGKNIDFILLVVTTMISSSEGHAQISELEKNPYFDVISRLLKPQGKSDLYYRLHREVWDVLGKAHSSPLQRFVTPNNKYTSQTEKILMDTLASASQINVIAKYIFQQHWHWLRADTTPKEYRSITGEIKKTEDCFRKIITEILSLLTRADYSSVDDIDIDVASIFSYAVYKGKELLEVATKLHDGLFSRLGIKEIKAKNINFPFFQEINKIKTEFEFDNKIKTIKWHQLGRNETEDLFKLIDKSEIEEVFVVWDEEIKEAVRDIFSNVCRVNIEIENPWKLTENKKSHIWCRIGLSKLTANIEMKNKTSDTAIEVKNKTKNSHSHYIIKDIGGDVIYQDDAGLLLTTISLPYAHTLQMQSKGEIK